MLSEKLCLVITEFWLKPKNWEYKKYLVFTYSKERGWSIIEELLAVSPYHVFGCSCCISNFFSTLFGRICLGCYLIQSPTPDSDWLSTGVSDKENIVSALLQARLTCWGPAFLCKADRNLVFGREECFPVSGQERLSVWLAAELSLEGNANMSSELSTTAEW